MRPECLVLVETTVPAGVCERVVLPILEEEREKRGITSPPHLAHSYERVMPGPNYVSSINRFWRTYAGFDDESASLAAEFLESFIDTEAFPLVRLENMGSSELAKLLENSYRAVNIAFIQEWTLFAEKAGIDLFAVIESIRVRKGTHDNIRYPGFGVGGYCLTKDSLLAQWALNRFFQDRAQTGVTLGMTLEGLRINYHMPLHTFEILQEICGGDLEGKMVAICGVSYLSEVADTRNSPAEVLVDSLLKAGASVLAHDPYVSSWPERPRIPLIDDLDECARQADAVVFTVPHPHYRRLSKETLKGLIAPAGIVVDAQNAIDDDKAEALHAAGIRIAGVGKGHWRRRGYHS
jgi:nucleotide sugar dehydrogenase